jgi:class 3 adenylate cyclase/tetratricopeptide (TPR) repeat protein
VAVCLHCGHEANAEFRFCPECGAAVEVAEARGVRKTVSVVFCDLVGSTAMGESTDPEALRGLLGRYFERMRSIVERHGGTVEKFIGDAVVAVFGVPAVHEDDALRACRAAIEMRDALPELGIGGRLGVNTGEVMTGEDDLLAAGDTMNVAARLEQAAPPGGVLIGDQTYKLVREAVEVEPVEPLDLKGKADPVVAHLLVSVSAAPERRHALPFVGRDRELTRILDAWQRASSEERCELVTVVGDAGVGKSRLVAEALAQIDGRVVRGRCLPYGEGITYWPVVEVVKQLASLPSDPVAAAAIGSLLGTSEHGTLGDEIAWAVRKLLEEQAPIVVVLDDLQWGEETFLDLVESTALLSTGAPILLLCMARPEMLERRPGWAGVFQLDPLGREQADALIGDDVEPGLRERITEAAGGNPLFISEMLAMAAEDAEVEVPPTLKALLAMRLDQLDEAERKVLERGSVEGEIFHRGAVQALAPEETRVTTRLAALVRHQLVRPDRGQILGDDGYRFRHLLIRDAAYDALPKAVRADLHVRFADWLDEHGGALVERDEIVGYHLGQAARYQVELAQPDPALANRAARRLATAGRRACDRLDFRTASALLGRAAELVRPHHLDLSLELEAAYVQGEVRVQAAVAAATAAADRAEVEGDTSGAMLGRAVALVNRTFVGEVPGVDEVIELCHRALPLEEARGDPRRLALLWEMLGNAANFRMQNDDDVHAGQQSFRYRRLAGDAPTTVGVEWPLILGPRPVDEAWRMLDELDAVRPPEGAALARAALLAMQGRFDEAWPLAEARSSHLQEISGNTLQEGHIYLWLIAVIEGDRERTFRHNADQIDVLVAGAAISVAAALQSFQARDLCYLGRFEEAESLLEEVNAVPPRATVRVMAPAAEALLLAERGEFERAEMLARRAVARAETETDNIWFQAQTSEDLATVLEGAGRGDEARAPLERAAVIWERKGCLPCANRVRERLALF